MDTGTINFWLVGSSGEASLPSGQRVAAKIVGDRLRVEVSGLGRHPPLSFDHPLPPVGQAGRMVTMTWNPLSVSLYLNGQAVESRELPG